MRRDVARRAAGSQRSERGPVNVAYYAMNDRGADGRGAWRGQSGGSWKLPLLSRYGASTGCAFGALTARLCW